MQQTLLKAHENLEGFRGKTDAELQALAPRDPGAAARAARPQVRPAEGGRTHSLEAALEQSSARLESLWQSEQSSPSQEMLRAEQLVELAMALAGLPEDQRTAVELRYLHGLSVPAVAEQMGRSTVSVTGLLYRGTKALRQQNGRIAMRRGSHGERSHGTWTDEPDERRLFEFWPAISRPSRPAGPGPRRSGWPSIPTWPTQITAFLDDQDRLLELTEPLARDRSR